MVYEHDKNKEKVIGWIVLAAGQMAEFGCLSPLTTYVILKVFFKIKNKIKKFWAFIEFHIFWWQNYLSKTIRKKDMATNGIF